MIRVHRFVDHKVEEVFHPVADVFEIGRPLKTNDWRRRLALWLLKKAGCQFDQYGYKEERICTVYVEDMQLLEALNKVMDIEDIVGRKISHVLIGKRQWMEACRDNPPSMQPFGATVRGHYVTQAKSGPFKGPERYKIYDVVFVVLPWLDGIVPVTQDYFHIQDE